MAPVPGAAGPHSGYPQWSFNTLTKIVSKVDNPTAKAIAITVSFPSKLIFFISQSAADAYMKNQGGGADISKTTINAAGNATTGIPNALAGGGIGSLFQSAIWERVAEAGVGLLLLYIGLKAVVTPQGAGSIAQQSVRQTVKHTTRLIKG
jgi:hypothetical protein